MSEYRLDDFQRTIELRVVLTDEQYQTLVNIMIEKGFDFKPCIKEVKFKYRKE